MNRAIIRQALVRFSAVVESLECACDPGYGVECTVHRDRRLAADALAAADDCFALSEAWERWGSRAQLDRLIGEMAKLTQAILHARREGATWTPEMASEIADVVICLQQVEKVIPSTVVCPLEQEKIGRKPTWVLVSQRTRTPAPEAPTLSDFEVLPYLSRVSIPQPPHEAALRPPCEALINLMLRDDHGVGIGHYTGGFPILPPFPIDSLQNALQIMDCMGVRDVKVTLSAPHKTTGAQCLIFRLGETPTVLAVTSFIPIDESDDDKGGES